MLDFQANKWKYSTMGLLAILAIGFTLPQAFAAVTDSILTIVKDVQSKINNNTYGLQAIKSGIDQLKTRSDMNLVTFDTTIAPNRDYFVRVADANDTNSALGGVLAIDVSGLSSTGHVETWCVNDGGGRQVGGNIGNGHYEIFAACQQFMIANSIFSDSSATVHGSLSYNVLYKP